MSKEQEMYYTEIGPVESEERAKLLSSDRFRNTHPLDMNWDLGEFSVFDVLGFLPYNESNNSYDNWGSNKNVPEHYQRKEV